MTQYLARTQSVITDRDWPKFYADIKAEGAIPDRSSHVINQDRAVFQAMYLDLADLKTQIANAGVHPAQTRIYADVLNIPEGLSWSLNDTALLIHARQVICAPGARVNLDYRTSKNATFLLFTNAVDGILNIYAIHGDNQIEEFPQDRAPVEGGVQVLYQNDKPTELDRTRAQGIAPVLPEELIDLIQTQFLFGSVIYDQDLELTLSIMTWLKDWAGVTTDLVDVFYRASALIPLLSGEINAKANGTEFVPYLSKDIYENLAQAYVAEVKDFEGKYLQLYAVSKLTENDIKLAQALRDNKTYEAQYVDKIVEQAKANYENARAASDAAFDKLKKAQDHAALVQIDFEKIGIPAWKRAKIAEAVITLGTAVVEFAVGVGSMFVGNEAGGAAAAGAATGAAKGVAQAASTAKKTAETAKKLAEAMEAIKKLVEGLGKISDLVKSILAVANDISKAESTIKDITGLDLDTGDADLTGTAEWQVYQMESAAAIQPAVDEGIEYSAELKMAVDQIVIYGQAYSAAQAAEIQEGQNYARTLLQKKLAEQQQGRLDQLVKDLKVGDMPNQEMMEEFYRRYVDSKSSLFSAMKGYQASYRYWALQPSSVQPRIIDPVDKLDAGLKQLTAIALDYKSALEHFSPPPQPFEHLVIDIDDAEVIQALQDTGETYWTLPLDQVKFRGDARVRLTTVRVWLDGNFTDQDTSVSMKITSEGNYLDRFKGLNYQFTSKPFERKFEYDIKANGAPHCVWHFANGRCGVVVVDGRVDDEVKYAYFEPTPFGQWRLKLSAGIDPKSITKISMELSGSLIGEFAEKAR